MDLEQKIDKELRANIDSKIGLFKQMESNDAQMDKKKALNLLFLLGYQNIGVRANKYSSIQDAIEYELANLDRLQKNPRKANIILPQARSVISRLLKNKATIVAEALTSDDRDVRSSKIVQEVLEDFWMNVNKGELPSNRLFIGMESGLERMFWLMLIYGEAIMRPYFNNAARVPIIVDGKVVEEEVGEVALKILGYFDYRYDRLGRFIIEKQVMSCDEVYERYGIEVKPEKIEFNQIESQVNSILGLGQNAEKIYTNAVIVYRYFERKTKKYPQGRILVGTRGQDLWEGTIPEEFNGELPHVRVPFQDLWTNMHVSRGLIEDMIPLQEDYNDTLKRMDDYKRMSGKLLISNSSNIKTKWSDEVGQIISVDDITGSARYLPPAQVPQFFFDNLERIKRDLQDITMTHDVSKARVPANVRSGYAVQLLQEKDEDELYPYLIKIESKIVDLLNKVLNIMKVRYSEERLIRITGRDKALDVRSFRGEDLQGNYRIKVSFGSWLPQSKQSRQEVVMAWLAAGLITPDEAKKYLEIGSEDVILDPPDQKRAEEELFLFKEGQGDLVQVRIYDNHEVHAQVFRDFMESSEFLRLPLITQQMIEQHWRMHAEALAAMQQPMMPQGQSENPDNVGALQQTMPPTPQGVA